MELSIIIVNYNVRELLLNAVASLKLALQGIEGEIIIVDNASSDGSIEALNRRFPDVTTIPLDENLGFGAANNVGIERATGEFILLINPDTIVQEGTLVAMLRFMRSHPDAAFAGCKILNPDGSFEPASKRGFPSPWSSFCRVFGLSKLFPTSRLFGGYNLAHFDPDITSKVDALSGCFMFCRADTLRSLGGFDTDFFMYGEDLDLCFRAKKLGGEIYYHPETTIMHLKGESTRRSSLDVLAMFYQAMEIFARKHFRSNPPLLWMIRIGIWFRRLMARINEQFPAWGFAWVDIAATLGGLILGSWLRFGDPLGFPDYALPGVLIIPSLAFVVAIAIAKGYGSSDRLLSRTMFGYLLGFFFLSALPYFFQQYAFSRGVVLVTTGFGAVVGVLARFLWLLYRRTFGAESIRRIAFLSAGDLSPDQRNGVRRMFFGKPISIEGVIAPTFGDMESMNDTILGTVETIAKLVRQYHLTDIFVVDSSISYGDVLRAMSLTTGLPVRYRILREGVESLSSALPQHFSLSPSHREIRSHLGKRLRERLIALSIILFGLPIVYLFSRRRTERVRELWQVSIGRRALVGGGAGGRLTTPVFSAAALCREETLTPREVSQIESYYAANESFLLDLEIIIASLRLRRASDGRGVAQLADPLHRSANHVQ